MSLTSNCEIGNRTLCSTLRRRRHEKEEQNVQRAAAYKQTEIQHGQYDKRSNEVYSKLTKAKHAPSNRKNYNNNNNININIHTLTVDGEASSKTIQAVEELKSLLRTRSLLNAELRKVDHVVHNLEHSIEKWGLLENTLHDVEVSVTAARQFVHKLIRVQSVDDVLFRLSVLAFIFVISYIIAQRVFGFFPVVKYVQIDRE